MPPNMKMATSQTDAIYIQQININSINNKKNEVGVYLDEVKCHILCINDTRLTKSKNLRFKGYKTFRKDHHSGKSLPGGVAILCQNELKAYEVHCSNNEMCIVQFIHAHKLFRVAILYLHPGQHLTQSHISSTTTQVEGIN